MSSNTTFHAPAQQPEPNTLRVENELLQNGFTVIPNAVLRSKGISRDAKLLYGILLSYAWQKGSCFPGYETLMADMQCQREALAKYIKELKEAELIEVQRRGQGKTSIYTLKDPRPSDPQKFGNRTSRSSENKQQGVRKSNGEEYSVKNTQMKNIRNSKGTPISENLEPSKPATGEDQPINAPPRGEKDRQPTETPHKLGDLVAEWKRTHKIPTPQTGSPPVEPHADGTDNPPEQSKRIAAPPSIKAAIQDFSREFHDEMHTASNLSQAVNLMKQVGFPESSFLAVLYTARAATKRQGNIQKRATGEHAPSGTRNRMPYFWAVLKDELGLVPQQPLIR